MTIEDLGTCELLCQLAEEASELSKAALKLRRAIDGRNPTPKTFEECYDNLIEEAADCYTVLRCIGADHTEKIFQIAKEKEKRWAKRLLEREHQ